MKKALIIRYGAYGDIIHMSHLPHLLKDEGFDTVDVETNFKGYQLLAYNPYIDHISGINPETLFAGREQMVVKHWEVISENYDKVVNLYNSLESGILAMENENIYFMSSELRRKKFSDINYYDQTTFAAGFPERIGQYVGEVYYTDEEHSIVNKWMEKFQDKFTILINLSGTGPHKRFVQAQDFAERVIEKFEDAHIITTGSADCKKLNLPEDKISDIAGKKPFRQALLIAKHVSCVVGCESGLMVGSSMWGTPTVQLMTAASIESHCKYNPNDFSLQSPAKCSPCHKGPYQYYGCPHKDGNPLCVYFDVNKIIAQIDKIYERRYVTV